MSQDHTTISVSHSTKEEFEEAKAAVQAELGEVTQDQALRELSEAYLGRDACGRWRGDNDD